MKLRLTVPKTAASPRVAWDDTPCPLCGRRDEELLLEAPDPTPCDGRPLCFGVVRCRACEFVYTNPRPTEECIGRFYPAGYRPHGRSGKGHAVRRERLLPWLGLGRLLDFGCGGGGFLKQMADRGWTVTGLDAAAGPVRRVQQELGLRAVAGSLPHPDLAPCSFDVVTMWHSLEHVHRPRAVLREAFRLLVPGGKLVVTCPNIESSAFHIFGPSWFGLDLPRHLLHFTPATLTAMLSTTGFRVRPVRLLRHSDWFRSSAKLASRNGGSGWARAMTWKPLAKMTAWLAHTIGRSDCMMAVAERPA
jgi:2-polyprenyl-3-methyl-5-hydroxy-6-metoxy-1,4-benzoquinol methylase